MRAAVLLLCALAAPASAQPRRALDPLPAADARWTSGLWAERFEACANGSVPSMGALMDGTARGHFAQNFRIAAGTAKGTHRGPAWNDGDYYKWIEAASAVYAVTKEAALDKQLDAAIELIAQAQRPDGYLHTPVLIANRNGGDAKPFQDRLNFEMYNFGHLFTAACVHHTATGKKALLTVALKAADFLCATFEKPTPELARNAVCPSHYTGTIDLYRHTREKKYLALAVKFLEMRDLAPVGTDDNQDRVPFRKQTEALGHAVRANYLYAGAADVYLETGDETLLPPLNAVWKSVVSRKMYVTGACGALYDGASPDGVKEQKQIARVHQSYGRDFQLPNSTAHNETCAAIGNVLWNWRMLQITGDAKHADVLELSLLNAVLAGVSLDGKRFFYTNTLRQLDTMPAALRWNRSREEWISCYCCPPNVTRVVAQAHTFAYGKSERGLWVHLFGASALNTEVAGGRVKLKQDTEYPWNGRVKFTVEAAPGGAWSLFVRVPGWAAGAKLTVNGEAHGTVAGRYAELRREWKVGDVVELNLPMEARLIESHPLVEETRNQVCVQRGPLVYCLESPDLPKGATVQTVSVPRAAKFAPRFEKDTLGGVTVLETQGELLAAQPWGDELYRPLAAAAPKALDLKLVPYFAWNNRGKSEMSVWLPLGR